HTNDAASSVMRLVDMGVEPFMVASSVVGIIAQRLVRKVCPACSEWEPMTPEEEDIIGRPLMRVKHAHGCNLCNNSGYKGRISLHEVLPMDKTLRQMITSGASVDEMKTYAVNNLGMDTLKESATQLVEQGITTVDELLKVAYYE
ncbi:MAG: Flp pilus assembly complex ATPase component TadA, partial [Lachnospiraceae bacterium]|nr:Flp pilus assembly complex ATPase component TadA [Lachnospiraceae bacterium]